MKKKLFYLYIPLLLFHSINSSAQNQISGIIKDLKNGQPLYVASIYIPDLKIGAASNTSGEYQLRNIPTGTYLVEISLIGYRSLNEKIRIQGVTKFDFFLAPLTYELNEVMLTDVATATKTRENPIPVSILNKNQLLQTASTNIIDAISVIPGVSEITLGPSISKPVIRGLGYNRVVIINDGIRQEGQQWFDEFGIEIDENSINKVEVLKGPASLRYGSDAMAGVINFLSPPTISEGNIKGNILGNFQTNNGLIDGSVNLAGNNKGFSWDLLYTSLHAHNYKNKYDGYVWNSGYSENNLKSIFGINKAWGFSHLTLSMFNLKLGIVEGLRDSATGKFEKHYLDSNGDDSLGIALESEYKNYNNYPIIHQHVRHYKAVLDNSFSMGTGRLNLTVGLQLNYRQEANDITKGDIYNNYFYLRTFNYDLQYILPEKNKWNISFGINGMQQSSDDKGIVFVLPEYNLFDIGAFSIAKKTFDKLTVTGGLRFDSRTLHGKDLFVDSLGVRLNAPDNNSIRRFTDYNSNFTGFSGSIGLAYDLSKVLYVKANLARGFRAPTAAESGQNGIHDGTPFYEIGEHNLKPENSLQVDGTLGINSDDVNGELNIFNNKINNYIFPVKLESAFGGDSIREDNVAGFSGPTFKYVAGDANLSGGELMINIHPHIISWLNFESAFSMVRAIQLHQPDSTKYLPYTPTDKWQSKLKFFASKLSKTFQNSYISFGVDHYFKQSRIYYQFGNETITPGYTLINLGIGTEIHSTKGTLCSIYLAGNNLADVAYQSNMSRLKYTDTNNVTGRIGVFNMGRNISFKLLVPIDFKK
jgi:iron complex outermembrane receptor protein